MYVWCDDPPVVYYISLDEHGNSLPHFPFPFYLIAMSMAEVPAFDVETGEGPPLPENTLDEPITATIFRDVRRVGQKLSYVLVPRTNSIAELRNWDLWGPLILCLTLATMLSWAAPQKDKALVFAAVFVVVWCGAAVVTFNAALLGGNISFFQSVCVLGYCIFPLNLASLLCLLYNHIIWRLCVVLVAFVWSTFASVGFMTQLVPPNRKVLAVYPVLLFYLCISWMIAIQADS